MKRVLVASLAKVDEAIDEVLYRPTVVRAFIWLPRWWMCDLAKLSIRLDDIWATGYWDAAGIAPGQACEACGRRASIHVYGGVDEEDDEGQQARPYLESRPVYLCGWCHLRGAVQSEDDVRSELAAARQGSISWRWRWRVRP